MKIKQKNNSFIYCMSLISCIWIILLFIYPTTQMNVFFLRVGDFWADFFNTLIYIADRDPYFNELNGTLNKNYLPFSYLILYPFTRMTNYSGITLSDCWGNGTALVCGFLFMLFSLYVFFHSLYLLCKKNNCNASIVLLVIFFSAANLYALERGNEILLSAACLNYFLLLKEDKRAWWIAVICLAIASVLKVFPAVFCLYYLRTRSYKLLSCYILASISLALLPFLFFEGGFDNIRQLYNNVVAQTAAYGQDSSVYRYGIIPLLLQIDEKLQLEHKLLFYSIGKYITYFLGGYSLLLSLKIQSSFIRIALLSMFCCLFPQQAFAYNVIYLFPVFIRLQPFVGQLDSTPKTLFIVSFLFIIIFFPIQMPDSISIATHAINNIGTILLWLVLLAIATQQVLMKKKVGQNMLV